MGWSSIDRDGELFIAVAVVISTEIQTGYSPAAVFLWYKGNSCIRPVEADNLLYFCQSGFVDKVVDVEFSCCFTGGIHEFPCFVVILRHVLIIRLLSCYFIARSILCSIWLIDFPLLVICHL